MFNDKIFSSAKQKHLINKYSFLHIVTLAKSELFVLFRFRATTWMQDHKSNFFHKSRNWILLGLCWNTVSWNYLYHHGYHEKATVFWLSFTGAILLEVLVLLSIGNKNFLSYLHLIPQPLLDIQCPHTGMKLLEMPLRWSALQIHLYPLKKSCSPTNKRHPNQARQRVSSSTCGNILRVTFFRFVSTEVSNLEA